MNQPRNILIAIGALLLSVCVASAQGTFEWIVTFDGAPHIPPSDAVAINYYNEEGMVFTIEPRLTVAEFGVVTMEEMILVTHDGAEYLSRPQTTLRLIDA